VIRAMVNQLRVYLLLLVCPSLVSLCAGCSGKPSPSSMERSLTERLGSCGDVVALENFKKLNGRDVDDRHYTAEVSYDLVLKRGINVPGNVIPADLKGAAACAFNLFMLTPVGDSFHDRTGVYPAGTRLHIGADDLNYEKTEKGWLPAYLSLGDLNLGQVTATETTEAKRKEAASDMAAKRKDASSAMAEMHEALDRYYLDNGSYPTTSQGLQALASRPSADGKRWGGPYIQGIPNDPWGHAYLYRSDGNTYALKSLGLDGIESADDIKGD
jgi:type II secretion system protein G